MKRALDNAQNTNFKERKKQKLADARTIAVQSVANSDNAVAGPSRLGPIVNDKLKQLPGAIDVERFAEARAFEINAMKNAMKSASSASTTRAWQVLPRHLRRRAASHDPRRVPLRLRDKARAEMDPIKRKATGRSMPKLGTARRVPKEVMFMKRQRDKRWLETHLWHAKRMKMENMWGYRLAVTPTEKSFRPSHRASVHGSILHDASYQSLIELKGPESVLTSILNLCCDAQEPGPGTSRFVTGSRLCKTHIHEPKSYPLGLICPAWIMWKSLSGVRNQQQQQRTSKGEQGKGKEKSTTNVVSASQQSKGKGKKKGKGKEKEKEKQPAGAGSANNESTTTQPERTLWVRFHPSVFDQVFATLRTCTSLVLDELRKANSGTGAGVSTSSPSAVVDVELADIRGEVGIFEIMGPKSNQVLRGALSPVMTHASDDFKRFWQSLGDVQTSDSVPANMVIGFTVNDPRLRFPPKNAKAHAPEGTGFNATVPPSNHVFPSAALASSGVWEQSIRNHLKKPRYATKDLNERKAKNLVPGTPLTPLRQDDRIPIILIQTSARSQTPSSTGAALSTTTSMADMNSHSTTITPPQSPSENIHGWTLIFPAGWSTAFLQQLIFTGTRVAGQRELRTQSFESSAMFFPRDFPGTRGYAEYAEERGREERAKWARTPKAKKVNYRKLGTRSPWVPDWEVVLGLREAREEEDTESESEAEDDEIQEGRTRTAKAKTKKVKGKKRKGGVPQFVSTQREPEPEPEADVDVDAQTMDVDVSDPSSGANTSHLPNPPSPPAPGVWLLRGPDTHKIIAQLSSVFIQDRQLVGSLNKLREKRGLDALDGSVIGLINSNSTTNDPSTTLPLPELLLKSALVPVRMSFCTKGSPKDMGIIYSISDSELREWQRGLVLRNSSLGALAGGQTKTNSGGVGVVNSKRKATNSGSRRTDKEVNVNMELYEEEDHSDDDNDSLFGDSPDSNTLTAFGDLPSVIPPRSSIIGYITSGGTSLLRGQGFALGAIPLVKVLELLAQVERTANSVKVRKEQVMYVKVRDRKQPVCRLARVEVMQ